MRLSSYIYKVTGANGEEGKDKRERESSLSIKPDKDDGF